MAKVRIKSLPKAASGLDVKLQGLRAGLGFNANTMPWPVMAGKFSTPEVEVNKTMQPVPREEANLEAEKGEVVMTHGHGGIPDTFVVGGKRHSEGGTPLNLKPESFIFSDTKDMRIKDPTILKQFGLPGKSYTPAEIARKYDIGEYKKVLADKDTDDIQKQSAEAMIKNYNLKLAKLALYQESMKGFPQGLPVIGMPYIDKNQIDPSSFIGGPGQPLQDGDQVTSAQLGGIKTNDYISKFPDEFFRDGGTKKVRVTLPKAQTGGDGWLADKSKSAEFAASNPEFFKPYLDAVKSGDKKKMEEVAKQLESADIPMSLEWFPGSDQNKLKDLVFDLRKRSTQKPSSSNNYQDKAKEVYAHFYKKMASLPEGSYERLVSKNNLDKVAEYHPDYYKNSPESGTSIFTGSPYTSKDKSEIDKLYKQVQNEAQTKAPSNKIPVVFGQQMQNTPPEKKQPAGTYKPKEVAKTITQNKPNKFSKDTIVGEEKYLADEEIDKRMKELEAKLKGQPQSKENISKGDIFAENNEPGNQ